MKFSEEKSRCLYPAVDAASWLVSRELHPRTAREAWMRDAPAMLRIGVHFDAIRLPAELVHHFADSEKREMVERALREAGIGGAVIVDPARRWYYALVPPGTAAGWREPGGTALGEDHYLGVPAPHRAEPPGTYWLLTPPSGGGDLCVPGAVRAVIKAGLRRRPATVRTVNWGRSSAL